MTFLNRRLLKWQILTVALMVSGYSGYYLCRSNLSVALPMIIADLVDSGNDRDIAKVRLGTILSVGITAYALGKFLSGGIADFFGGKRNFVGGMLGSICFTVLFALGGTLPIFTIAWFGNRLSQSLGWVGMVKVTSRWFSFSRYGTVMGIISLSYLFGDALARTFMGFLIGHGYGWQAIFLIDAGVLAVLLLINLVFLRESPTSIGAREPPVNPDNVFGPAGEKPEPEGLKSLLAGLLRKPAFWLVCLLSLGLTLLRETFNTWTPTYFTEGVHLSEASAAEKSALFPFFGGLSVLVAGVLSDRFGRGWRAAIIGIGLVLSGGALLVLGIADFGDTAWLPICLVTLIAFLMIGPYSYLAGAVSLDFGGKQGSATACGIIDGVGYVGGILAGDSVARVSVAYGWPGAFVMLAAVSLATAVAALFFWLDQSRPRLTCDPAHR